MPSSIQVKDVQKYLETFAPPDLAEDWDNIGLQVGIPEESVSGILVSLDVTEAVIWEAVEHGANLLITHHPLFFRSVNALDHSTVPKRLARLAVQTDLNVLSFHTNLDSTSMGLNDLLAKTLGLKNLRPLLPAKVLRQKAAGLGRVGKVKPTSLQKFIKEVSKALKRNHLGYVGDLKHPIQTVAVMTGSGAGFFGEAKQAGADVLVTGDVKYHFALDALAEGMAMIDVGHFAGEIGMVGLVAKKLRHWLKSKNSKLKVFETKMQADPIQFWTST